MVDLLVFASLVTFFGLSIMNILPAVADDVLNGDSQTFGLLMGSSGAGALISTLFLLPLSQQAKRIGRIVGGAAVWMGIFYFLLSRSTFCRFRNKLSGSGVSSAVQRFGWVLFIFYYPVPPGCLCP